MTNQETIANLNMISVAFVEPVTKEQRKLIDDTFDNAIKALEQEPSSLENPNKWIPVSERLPEEGQRILVSQTTEYGYRVEITEQGRFGFLLGIVDAWMPLPEPYKAERSDKE